MKATSKHQGQEFCQLNHSPSKMSYSFSKENRFRTQKININQTLYQLPSKMDKRAAGFGYGNKSSIILPILMNPSPNTYQIQSDLVLQQRNKKGSIFGQSRDRTKHGSFMQKERAPGPADYDIMKSSLTNIGYTIPQKHRRSVTKGTITPGPGQYETGMYNKSGFSILSCIKDSRVRINPIAKTRQNLSNNPGPGAYQNHSMDIQKGSFYNSKLKSTQKCIFPKTIRSTKLGKENSNPGPGTYTNHSDFS